MYTQAGLTYSVQVAGPAGITVPVIVRGEVATVATVSDTSSIISAVASVEISDPELLPNPSGILVTADACSSIEQGVTEICYSYPSDVLISSIVPVQSDDILDVSLSASASLESGSSFGNFASAFADPSFEIDPSFPLADEFSIALSPGIGNPVPSPSGVPEPASLALLAVALSGFAVCRRQG
jgi:hypothetical protein